MSEKPPFILITGDDSIRAEGSILVKKVVEKFADFKIIATKDQQSGVGGKITLKGECKWGTEIVDGIEAIWVDGTPGDAVYFAFDYLKRKPDLVISGMNTGPNFSDGSLFISGTVAAASIAANSRQTPTIAFSFNASGDNWMKIHNGDFNEELIDYPGKMIERFIRLALKHKMPKGDFWNINFPVNPTEKIKVVETYKGAQFPNRVKIVDDKFSYIPEFGSLDIVPENTDVKELSNGFITFTPCRTQFTKQDELERLQGLIRDGRLSDL
jgi:5'-nucleotidase